MTESDQTELFRGPRMLNTHFAITTDDVPLVNVCYGMQGEDLIVRELFKAELRAGKIGFYADFGAYDSRYGSNTYLFYQYGWRGICVEPNPNLQAQHRAIRPRDIFVGAAVGMDGNGYWAESKLNQASSRVGFARSDFGPDFEEPLEIPLVSLNRVFSELLPTGTAIDYISIDLEGHELVALQSNDWTRFRPRVIVIEENALDVNNLFGSPSLAFLRDQGYKIAGITPPNVILRAS